MRLMNPTGPAPRSTPADEARGRPLADLALEWIWWEGPLSRADLARDLGLSRSTASEIVATLLETGLVAEGGEAPSSGGRRPILLEFQDDAHSILGVDMGASHVSVALTDLRGRVLAWRYRDHAVRTDPGGTLKLIGELCDAVLDEGPGRDRLMGLGIAVPSPIDPRFPERISPTVMPDWQGRTGFGGLARRYDVPVLVDNDANLGAVAERWWGAGRDVDHFTFIKLATGIGAGHIIDGRIYRGATSVAGEIGHVSIDPAGEPCVCGNRGCLVTFAGASALVARAEAEAPSHPGSPLSRGDVSLHDIEDAALAGDPLAVDIVGEAAHHLGVAVAGLLNLMNPGAVILGGSLTRVGDTLLVPLREAVVRRTLVASVAASDIQISPLGERSVAVGAATHVLAAALTTPSLFPSYRS